MADVIIASPGVDTKDTSSPKDRLKLFLKVFSGQVLTAFTQSTKTGGKFMERTIEHGKSATFPVVGRAKAKYLKAGKSLDDLRTPIEHGELDIKIDGLLTSDCLIFDLDEAMSHYDLASKYSKEMGEALAVAQDCAIIAEVAKLVVADTENIPTNSTTGVKGTGKGAIITKTGITIGENEQMGKAIAEMLLQIKTKMSENYVPEGERYCYIRPVAMNALLANKDVLNKLYGATVTIDANTQSMKLFGFDLIETTDLTMGGAAVNAGVVQGSGHVFPAAYVDSAMFLVAHRTAVGTLTLKDLAMEHARRANLQADEIIAKYAKGYDGLRPEAAFMGVVTAG